MYHEQFELQYTMRYRYLSPSSKWCISHSSWLWWCKSN